MLLTSKSPAVRVHACITNTTHPRISYTMNEEAFRASLHCKLRILHVWLVGFIGVQKNRIGGEDATWPGRSGALEARKPSYCPCSRLPTPLPPFLRDIEEVHGDGTVLRDRDGVYNIHVALCCTRVDFFCPPPPRVGVGQQ